MKMGSDVTYFVVVGFFEGRGLGVVRGGGRWGGGSEKGEAINQCFIFTSVHTKVILDKQKTLPHSPCHLLRDITRVRIICLQDYELSIL